MKKLFDNRFLFIVALSLVVLIILGIGAFYLFDDKDDVFTRNGYVINPLSGKVEKYFFNEQTPYKENLSSMVVFKDVDNKKTSILKDSFLHYNDGSLSFLTNGAILDLDTINGNETVNFYNITSASIIDKIGNGYVIKNSGDDINLKNFIGRISENKYIVVGKLEAKIPGNEKNISGDYFEIAYSEKGIVNIENKDVKFQVTAEGTQIYAGNIIIDLGAKKITQNGVDIMSITSITIDGDENIEIIPKVEEEEENTGANDNNDGNENGQNDNNQNEGGNAGNVDNGTGEGGTGLPNTDANINTTQDIVVSLEKAAIGNTSIDVAFDIYNEQAGDTFTLSVTNLESGRTVDVIPGVTANEEIRINLLSPNTKYLFTVTNDGDGNTYFQKIFETTEFGVKLEKTYATDSELGFKVTIDKDTNITNARLSLYKYNEETKQNEIVKTSYYDNVSDGIKYSEKVTYLSNANGTIEGVHEIVYDGLDSNTIYTAVLDDFTLTSVNFKDVYNITETAMTLKKSPKFSEMTVGKDVVTGTFRLSLTDIIDEDNAIESYTYKIYEVENPNELAIEPIVKGNASPIEVKIGDKENQLKNDINYFYKVVIEYFDNEKYIEYILDDTITFVMGSDPQITVVPREDKISYDRIGATIYLTDNSCLISMPGREKCPGNSSTKINVTTITSTGIVNVFSRTVDFEVVDDEVKYELLLDGLQEATTYTIEVDAIRNDRPELGLHTLLHTNESKKNITTKSFTTFVTDWVNKGSSANHVVNLEARFIADETTGTLGPVESAMAIKKVVAKLYNGSYVEDFSNQVPIATASFANSSEFSIKENFYDNGFSITTDETFGLDIDGLKAKNDGQLSEYYTIALFAYYDDNGINEVLLTNNVTSYKISPLLLMENIEEPLITIAPISKSNSGLTNNLIDTGTIVGYEVTGNWDSSGLSSNGLTVTGANLYVYNANGDRVSFYVKDGDNNLVLVDGIENDSASTSTDYVKQIFMDYGSDYYVNDTVMSRGNSYYIGYQLIVNSSLGDLLYPSNTNNHVPNDFGKYSNIISTEKETPAVTMYVAKSTANSITYKYTIRDPDNALYKDSNSDTYKYYYVINDGEARELDLTRNTNITDYNAFTGELKITGLESKDTYYLYYKKNSVKTGNIENDVHNYVSGNSVRVFDGYYDLSDEGYNFKYKVINPERDNELTNEREMADNKVTFQLLADEEILDRVVSYKVTFTDSVNPNNKLVKNLWKLGTCPGDSEDAAPKCFSVDYVELKDAGMKSTPGNPHTISVSIVAYYDNGITGYDYKVGKSTNAIPTDYDYMIFQNNLVPDGTAKYVTFIVSGVASDNTNTYNLALWKPENNIEKGYYTYSISSSYIVYESGIYDKKRKSIRYSIDDSGYFAKTYGTLNPKMISTIEMDYVGDNEFSFNSITPKVKVERTVSLINGANISLTLSGADMSDFCEEGNANTTCNNNSDFYLYVDVWDDATSASQNDRSAIVRPTVKVKINKDNPSETITAVVDKLSSYKQYYYNVYAYLNKNGHPKYTQLFNDSTLIGHDEVKTYNFRALSASEIYTKFTIEYRPNTLGAYSDKLLDTTINLKAYQNGVPFNFDLNYAFCQGGDSTCGIGNSNTNIFKRSIGRDAVGTVISDTVDISNMDVEFDKNYYVYIYALYDCYYIDQNTNEFAVKTINLLLNGSEFNGSLKALKSPKFTIERKAVYVDGEYAIDFTIDATDIDRVLEDGKYYVALRDAEGNIVGDLQVKQDNNFVTVASNGDYDDYAFDALVSNKQIRIIGLDPATRYTISIYNRAYINNYDENIPKENRYFDIVDSRVVYSTDNSGVAFGKELQFSATARSFVVTFLGGSSFENVREVGYTIGLWDNNSSEATYSGSYTIGENKAFEQNMDTETNSRHWKFVIDDSRINNTLGQTYTIALSFRIVKGQEEFNYNSIDYPEFAGRAQYVED